MNNLASFVMPICTAAARPLYCATGNSCDQSSALHESVLAAGIGLATYATCKAVKWTWQQIQTSGGGLGQVANILQHAPSISRALAHLHQAGILTQENRNALIQNPQYASSISRALARLHQAGILTQENRNALIQNPQHVSLISDALADLRQAGILTQENFNALIQNLQYALSISRALAHLHQAGILTQENFNVLLQDQGMRAEAISDQFDMRSAIDQACFDEIVEKIVNKERASVHRAATVLGQGMRTNSLRLPPALCAKIAVSLFPTYENGRRSSYEKWAYESIWKMRKREINPSVQGKE